MYSLRMSFWSMPETCPLDALALGRGQVQGQEVGAVALIVIEVETSPSGSRRQICMSARLEIGTDPADLPFRLGASES